MFGILVCSCLTPPPPAHSSGQQALIIRPAFSPQPTCHLAIWSKELTNREMSTASAKYQFVGAAQYSRSIALLPRWAAWGHAQPKPGVLDMPHLLASGSSMPASPSARLGMEETKGWVGLALFTMRTPFASSEDNRHSCASPATGVARPGISNTVAKNNLHHHHDSCHRSQQYGHKANPKKWVPKRGI